MRVADYIFQTLADRGTKHVFLVTGGGAMHLNDALRREKRLRYICCLHEQACAMAAEGYARIASSPGIVSVTTGPGGTNALTGVLGAWVDSIPMLVISGQVKRATTIEAAPGIHLRQLGDQEINIVDIVRPITKYAVMVRRPEEIVPVLDRAWKECRSGRPGPVWIDVPQDIQAAELPDTLRPGAEPAPVRLAPDPALLREAVERLRTARRRPVCRENKPSRGDRNRHYRTAISMRARDHPLGIYDHTLAPCLSGICSTECFIVINDEPGVVRIDVHSAEFDPYIFRNIIKNIFRKPES